MPRTWFTADLHVGHAAIIGLCNRPFLDISEHDAVIIDNWNARVAPGDDVYVVGDFCWSGPETVAHTLRKLRGRKHLIHGNHDRPSVRTLKCWASSSPLVEIQVEGQRIVLCHYSLRTWRGVHRGALHFYGHSHGNLPGIPGRSCDVGVDCFNFRPASLDKIRERIGQPDPLASRAA